MEASHGGLGLCDLDVRLPRGDDPVYSTRVFEFLDDQRVDIFLPVMEPELLAMCGFASDKILVSNEPTILMARSKRRQNLAFRDAGLVPMAEVEAHWAGKELFARPDFGTGSRGAVRIGSEPELNHYRKAHSDAVYCEYLAGTELSFDGFADQNGILRGLVTRRRVEVRNGLAVKSEIVQTPTDISRRIAKFVAHNEVRGFFNLQAIQVENDFFFHDFNPRLGGAMYLSFVGGLPADTLLKAWIKGGPWPTCQPKVGTKLFRRYENVIQEPLS